MQLKKPYALIMNTNMLEILSNSSTVSLPIDAIADWIQAEEGKGSRLFLAPIQRSLVWSNEQIINYWDSLLRGYPAGMMIVHRVAKRVSNADSQACDANGKTQPATEQDFLLFDGQQRLTAVLLGLGIGKLKESRKLWVDFGKAPDKSAGLLFQLRISSTGQPFGYRPEASNQKVDLGKRQGKWMEWRERHGNKSTPGKAFSEVAGSDLIDARCAIAFADVFIQLKKDGCAATIANLIQQKDALPDVVNEFVCALKKALTSKVVVQRLEPEIVANQDEYFRFFGRLGQGGTRLSDEELTYSIIKHQYPEIRERMQRITDGKAGRLACEVDLVLSALRVAKTLTPLPNAKEWETISRPTPAFVSQLKSKDHELTEAKFLEIVGVASQPALLELTLVKIRKALAYENVHDYQKGLPPMLLARLPRELVDVLILFTINRGASPWGQEEDGTLRAFVLYWLYFVGDDAKAAWCAFRVAKNVNWIFTTGFIRDLIAVYEKEGIARFIPRQDLLQTLRNDVVKGDHHLRPWSDRFASVDVGGEYKPGEALRVLSTNGELIKRALMWLQRDYIDGQFSNYDPTSGRDEDLPIDLDHIIPQDVFAFHWSACNRRLDENSMQYVNNSSDNFRWQRSTVGNSLGNYRWLAASENRRRGKGEYAPLENNGDSVSDADEWNKIIPQAANNNKRWSPNDIASFQRLVDMRTLQLYERILTESGIEDILPPPPAQRSAQ